MHTLFAIVFCAGGLGLVLFAAIVATTELQQRRQASAYRSRNRRKGR